MVNAPGKKNLVIADLPIELQNKIRNRVKRSAGAHSRGVSHQWKNDYNLDKCKLRGPVGLLNVGDIVELRNVSENGNMGRKLSVMCTITMVGLGRGLQGGTGIFTRKPHGDLVMLCDDESSYKHMLVRTVAPTPNKSFKDLGWHLVDNDLSGGPLPVPIFVIPKRRPR